MIGPARPMMPPAASISCLLQSSAITADGGDPAELPAARDERPDPGQCRGDQERDDQRPERGVWADGGVEPRGQDDRRCEEQRVPRQPGGSLHAAALEAG